MEYNKVQRAKRKKSTQLGHEEEERVMRILHKLVDLTRAQMLITISLKMFEINRTRPSHLSVKIID